MYPTRVDRIDRISKKSKRRDQGKLQGSQQALPGTGSQAGVFVLPEAKKTSKKQEQLRGNIIFLSLHFLLIV